MQQDIRIPLGLTFLTTGLLLVAYGGWTHGQTMYKVCGGLNLNLYWGAVMVLFGLWMLRLVKRRRAA